jgi:peptide/nickel transport system ATP-binding protein
MKTDIARAAAPQPASAAAVHLRSPADAMLRVEHLEVRFPTAGGTVHAVSDVSFDVLSGETLGLVGESGCGKSTTGRAILQLPRPTAGAVYFEGTELTGLASKELRQIRPRLQMIFQDPISSLNPRRRVFDIVAEPLAIAGVKDGVRHRVNSLLEQVGLDPGAGDRRPHQFSGGQCQRISIARALMLEPKVLICDEPVSALDVSVQAQILNLLEDLKERYGLTMVFIAHDLAVVKNVSDRVAVMYLGKLCEVSPPDELYRAPRHPYSAALIEAIPVPDPAAPKPSRPLRLTGELPSPVSPPSGCRFRTRCPRAQQRCAEEEPVMRELSSGHYAACHFPLDVAPGATSPTAPPA